MIRSLAALLGRWRAIHRPGPVKPCPHAAQARWMALVNEELGKGIRETAGEHSAELGKFFDDTPYEGNPAAATGEIPWCAAFVNWVMEKSGYNGVDTDGNWDSVRALKWVHWPEGRVLPRRRPVYGALAIKARGGGGHIGFVAGKKGGKLVIVGGNQSDELNASAYDTRSFVAFVVPKDYQVCPRCHRLPDYGAKTSDQGSEN